MSFRESGSGSSSTSQLLHQKTDLMDWYFGGGVDELVVPKEQELSDRLPSPESWLQWGISAPESFGSPNKYFVTETKPVREELNFNGKRFCEVGVEIFTREGQQSSGSSVCSGLLDPSPRRTTLLRDQPDYQLDDMAEIDQMDDIFLSSLLEEEMSGTENLDGSFCFSPRSQCTMTPADNLLTDMILDSQSVSSDLHGMGSSKYLKTFSFSPSVGWEKGEVSTSHFVPCNLGQKVCPPGKAPVERVSVPSEQNSANGHVGDKSSVEESVLQDLEMVMTQLTEKTRICFRDALFRLAKNSKENTITQSQNGDLALEKPPMSTVHDETLRSGRTKARESETNTIDRAIANLMFSKTGFNTRDFPSESVGFEERDIAKAGLRNYSLNQSQISCGSHSTFVRGDAEVPIFGLENPSSMKNLGKDYSRNGAVTKIY